MEVPIIRILFRSQFARWTVIPWITLMLAILIGRVVIEDGDIAAILCLPFTYLFIRSINLGVVVIPQQQKLKIRGYLFTRSLDLVDERGCSIEAYDDDYAGPLFLYGDRWGSVSFRDSTGETIARVPALGSRVGTAARNRRGINQAISFARSIPPREGPMRAKQE